MYLAYCKLVLYRLVLKSCDLESELPIRVLCVHLLHAGAAKVYFAYYICTTRHDFRARRSVLFAYHTCTSKLQLSSVQAEPDTVFLQRLAQPLEE